MKNLFFTLFLFFVIFVSAQPVTTLTPLTDMGLHDVTIEVPQKFSSLFPSNKTIKIPAGYKAKLFYTGGLNQPRFISFSPAGVLHVSDMKSGGLGKIYAFPDLNKDGVADTIIAASQGYTNNHDVKFYNGAMYVTETTKVWKCLDTNKDGIYETKTIFIDSITWANSSKGHFTRTIVFDSVNHKLYLSIGSSCNVCRENDRAIIEQYNDDGSGKRTFATGIRNAIGMALHPKTNKLWANNNGSDGQGNEIPPEWIDIVRDGGFYGHPFAYSRQDWFDFSMSTDYPLLKPITAIDSGRVATVTEPAARIRAHYAPMALQFLNASFPSNLNKGFLTAVHGSWNTTAPNAYRGYKVLYANLSDDNDTTVNYVSDFCSGFLTDSINRTYWGRPVGLAVDNNGNVFMSSDAGTKFLLLIYPDGNFGLTELQKNLICINVIYPNPFHSSFTFTFTLSEKNNVAVAIYDLIGNEIKVLMNEEFNVGDHKKEFEFTGISNGLYILKIKAGDQMITQKISCIK